MSETKHGPAGSNPKVDMKIVEAFRELERKLPESARPARGSNYRIAPPLGGQALTLERRKKQRD